MYDYMITEMAKAICDNLKEIEKPSSDIIEVQGRIEEILKDYWKDKIASTWNIEDVRTRLLENYGSDANRIILTDAECKTILDNVLENIDANYGICWDNIDTELDSFLESKSEESERPGE